MFSFPSFFKKCLTPWRWSNLKKNLPFWTVLTFSVFAGGIFSGPALVQQYEIFQLKRIEKAVFPESTPTRIAWDDVVEKMIKTGVIDEQKMRNLYSRRGGIPPWAEDLMKGEAKNKDILISAENAPYLLNFLWPLGLANRLEMNEYSPVYKNRYRLAATGGWTLGQAENGGVYFNEKNLLGLTSRQQDRLKEMAKNIYRPCCNNHAFFQDCNHGSAMLGFLQLGIRSGLSEPELWKLALKINTFWYPEQYRLMALARQKFNDSDWQEDDPQVLLGKEYSSASGWRKSVLRPLQKAGLLPAPKNQTGGGCAV